MQSCSIRGCESYKTVQWKPVAYFKFPFNNIDLLQAWLMQINQPDFSPTAQDQICSTHFLIEDIEPTSIGRYPILKPDAIPSVFPEGRENIEPPKRKRPKTEAKIVPKSAQQLETILIPDFGKPIPILPKPSILPHNVMHISPKSNILSPTKFIAAPIQFQTTPVSIQPKPVQLQTQVVKLQSPIQLQGKSTIQSLPSEEKIEANKQNSPRRNEPKTPIQKSPVAKPSQTARPLTRKSAANGKILSSPESFKGKDSTMESPRPVLKISINKISKQENKRVTRVVRKKPEEVLVTTSNKSVIFRLDPSGQIVVETLKNSTRVPPEKKSENVQQSPPKPRTPDSKLTNLKSLYNKAEEDCAKLSQKLASLKQRHQEEQEQILKLQGILTEPSTEGLITNSDLSKNILKKRKIVTQEEEEDEYEKLLREVRKIKEDHDKNSATKVNNKETVSIKTEEISVDSEDPEMSSSLTQDETINTTVDRKRVAIERTKSRKIVENTEENVDRSDEIVGLIEENQDFDSEDEMNFEAEYLDPEFVDC